MSELHEATPSTPASAPEALPETPAKTQGGKSSHKGHKGGGKHEAHPLLEQFARELPKLFGQHLLPLRRGIYDDLKAAYPQVPEDDLKQALALHTRSTRYLQAVASGQARHGLDGKAEEAVADEHVFHALAELYRRKLRRAARADAPRQQEQQKQAREWLEKRLQQAMHRAPQGAAAFVQAAHTRDATIAAMLERCAAQITERNARDEAMLRAFEASGAGVAEFADMYGMSAQEAGLMLARARMHAPTASNTETAADTSNTST